MSVTYIRSKSRTERPRKTKIGTEVAHITRDLDTTLKVKRSKVNLQVVVMVVVVVVLVVLVVVVVVVSDDGGQRHCEIRMHIFGVMFEG